MVNVCKLSKSFNSGKTFALNNVSFQLEKGKSYGVIGESGSGKTTLTRLLCGLELPTSGEISIDN